jgi:pyruvate/2-oxoglutarate dehydrogenase complex dihydrolipoamide dehydrogenase (E3) component
METMKFDDIVIGFGKGGKTLAAELAKRGFKTAMVERSEKMYGGTCINIGCIPTKTLVHQAKMAACGTNKNFEAKRAFYREAIAEKDRVTSALRQKNYGNLANNDLVTVFTGEGTFTSANTVSVSRDRETVELQAPQIFINTGSETIIPAIDGIQNNPFVYTSTSLMNLKELPKRLVIIGGGYIGLEYASMYASFGSEVTILESGNSFIPREDRDVADAVKARLEKMGVRVFLNTKVQSVFEKEKNAVVSYLDLKTSSEEHLEAEAVLLATGRKPATASLHLAAAGIETDERGAIKVDEHLVTTNPDVRAMGDVKGGPQFTYISLDDFRIVRDDLFGEKQSQFK